MLDCLGCVSPDLVRKSALGQCLKTLETLCVCPIGSRSVRLRTRPAAVPVREQPQEGHSEKVVLAERKLTPYVYAV
ncbi:hypothetical protein TIFTF001_053428, partial [Ficus carica]